MPGPSYYNYKYNTFGSQCPRREAQERADKAGDGFPALKSQEYRIGVTCHHGQSRDTHPQHILPGEASGDPDGGIAFGDIEQQGHDAGGPSRGAHDGGGADIAAAGRAHIGAGFPFDQNVSERNRAEQVRDNYNSERNDTFMRGTSARLV